MRTTGSAENAGGRAMRTDFGANAAAARNRRSPLRDPLGATDPDPRRRDRPRRTGKRGLPRRTGPIASRSPRTMENGAPAEPPDVALPQNGVAGRAGEDRQKVAGRLERRSRKRDLEGARSLRIAHGAVAGRERRLVHGAPGGTPEEPAPYRGAPHGALQRPGDSTERIAAPVRSGPGAPHGSPRIVAGVQKRPLEIRRGEGLEDDAVSGHEGRGRLPARIEEPHGGRADQVPAAGPALG